MTARPSRGLPFARLVSLGIGAAAVALLFRHFGIDELAAALGRVRPWILLPAALVGTAVRIGYALRWRFCAASFGISCALRRFVQARLAGDALGAVLPTGRIGGDPLRVALLREPGAPAAMPTASVALDRFVEWVGNTFCALGCVMVFAASRADAASGATTWLLVTMVAALAALIAPLTMLRCGRRPFKPLYRLEGRVPPGVWRWLRLLYDTETQLSEVFRHRPRVVTIGMAASLVLELAILLEYRLLLGVFGIDLGWPTMMMVVVTGGLARAVPIPAGLGALEASQVGLLAVAAGAPEMGFVVGIVLRMHEAFWVLAGFVALAMQGGLERLRLLLPAGGAAA